MQKDDLVYISLSNGEEVIGVFMEETTTQTIIKEPLKLTNMIDSEVRLLGIHRYCRFIDNTVVPFQTSNIVVMSKVRNEVQDLYVKAILWHEKTVDGDIGKCIEDYTSSINRELESEKVVDELKDNDVAFPYLIENTTRH
jgi:hypothetical protein